MAVQLAAKEASMLSSLARLRIASGAAATASGRGQWPAISCADTQPSRSVQEPAQPAGSTNLPFGWLARADDKSQSAPCILECSSLVGQSCSCAPAASTPPTLQQLALLHGPASAVAAPDQSFLLRYQPLQPQQLGNLIWTLGHPRSFSTSAALQQIRQPPQAVTRPPEAEVGEPKPDLVKQFLSAELMASAERNKLHLQAVARGMQRFDGDTGSSEVQVAVLTEKIKLMAEHMRVHRKDFHSRRGLEAMLTRRRKLLQYLRRTDFDTYTMLLTRLGLKDNYGQQGRLMRYKAGREGSN